MVSQARISPHKNPGYQKSNNVTTPLLNLLLLPRFPAQAPEGGQTQAPRMSKALTHNDYRREIPLLVIRSGKTLQRSYSSLLTLYYLLELHFNPKPVMHWTSRYQSFAASTRRSLPNSDPRANLLLTSISRFQSTCYHSRWQQPTCTACVYRQEQVLLASVM